VLAGTLAVGAGCHEVIQPSYSFQIVGPFDHDYFAGAQEVVLEIGGTEVARQTLAPNQAFRLSAADIDTPQTPTTHVTVKALDADGKLLAYGQTPEIELTAGTRTVRVFVQKPGTMGRVKDLGNPLRGHVSIAAPAPIDQVAGALSITIPVFGT